MLTTDKTGIGEAIGRVPSGCAILTVAHEGRSTGMLASWIQQAAFEPPMVTVSVKRDRPVQALLDPAGRFMLNVLGEGASAMFRHFGRGFAPEDDAFAGLEVRETEFGPALAEAVAHLGCIVRQKIEVGDHDLYVGEVVAGQAKAEAPPYTHIRKSGLNY